MKGGREEAVSTIETVISYRKKCSVFVKGKGGRGGKNLEKNERSSRETGTKNGLSLVAKKEVDLTV